MVLLALGVLSASVVDRFSGNALLEKRATMTLSDTRAGANCIVLGCDTSSCRRSNESPFAWFHEDFLVNVPCGDGCEEVASEIQIEKLEVFTHSLTFLAIW